LEIWELAVRQRDRQVIPRGSKPRAKKIFLGKAHFDDITSVSTDCLRQVEPSDDAYANILYKKTASINNTTKFCINDDPVDVPIEP
jgi:hypothetical protein